MKENTQLEKTTKSTTVNNVPNINTKEIENTALKLALEELGPMVLSTLKQLETDSLISSSLITSSIKKEVSHNEIGHLKYLLSEKVNINNSINILTEIIKNKQKEYYSEIMQSLINNKEEE
jgi:hypothetical protein